MGKPAFADGTSAVGGKTLESAGSVRKKERPRIERQTRQKFRAGLRPALYPSVD
jgi:hypothetical protein